MTVAAAEKPEGKDEKPLLFGKYKTMEEAEKGHKELERHATEKGQEASRYKESLDAILSEPREKPTLKTTDDADVVVFQEGESEETFAERFMSNPRRFLRAIKNEARREASEEATAHTELFVATRDFIGSYLNENPDVRQNGKLFSLHLANTNPKEKLGKRLDDAAKMTREEITRIREDVKKSKDFQKKQTDKADTVEGGDDNRDADVSGVKPDEAEGQSFDAYMKNRQAQHAKFTGMS